MSFERNVSGKVKVDNYEIGDINFTYTDYSIDNIPILSIPRELKVKIYINDVEIGSLELSWIDKVSDLNSSEEIKIIRGVVNIE
jgi:hypothetical protein